MESSCNNYSKFQACRTFFFFFFLSSSFSLLGVSFSVKFQLQ